MDLCVECDAALPVVKQGPSGYAIRTLDNSEQIKICYDCAAWHEQESMDRKGAITLYFNQAERTVKNWTGKLSYWVRSVYEHGPVRNGRIRPTRIDVWIYHNGAWWHGFNGSPDNQDCITFRRLKAKKAKQLSRSYWLGY